MNSNGIYATERNTEQTPILLPAEKVISKRYAWHRNINILISAYALASGCAGVVGDCDFQKRARTVRLVAGLAVGVIALISVGFYTHSMRKLELRHSNALNNYISAMSATAALVGIGLSTYSAVEFANC